MATSINKKEYFFARLYFPELGEVLFINLSYDFGKISIDHGVISLISEPSKLSFCVVARVLFNLFYGMIVSPFFIKVLEHFLVTHCIHCVKVFVRE